MGASCGDCHSVHDLRGPADPKPGKRKGSDPGEDDMVLAETERGILAATFVFETLKP